MSRLRLTTLNALLLATCAASTLPEVAPAAENASADGAVLLADSGLPGGICLVIGGNEAQLALSLAEDKQLVVQLLTERADDLALLRETIRAAGAYGRVSADLLPNGKLPYADNLLNIVVAADPSSLVRNGIAMGELTRVCAPKGIVYTRSTDTSQADGPAGWKKTVKPWPADIDEWTHYLHDANGNPVAQDRQVGPPQRFQWLGGPLWAQSHESDTNLRGLVTANGRLYYIVNEAETSLAGPESPPDKWFLTARDAFNGVVLWKRPVEHWGWREWKPSWFTPRPGVIPLNLDKRFVAHGDLVYTTLGFRAPVSEIDGKTGEVLRTFAGTERCSEILVTGDSMVLTILDGDAAVVKRVDLKDGQIAWQTNTRYAGTTVDYYRFTAMRGAVPEAKVDPTLALATDGETIALLDGDSVVGLDFADGSQRWRSEFPLAPEDAKAGNIDAGRRVWNGAVIVADGVVLHASPNSLAAFSAQSGEILWHQPKKFLQHLWYEWQDVFVIDDLVWTWSSELARERLQGGGGNSIWPVSANGYDLHSGELKREVPLANIFKTHHHHRCYRNKATVRYIIASRRGSEFVDLEQGDHSVNNWVRGACHMGMMPANGLQYAPPHPCQCYVDEKLKGFVALAAIPQPPTILDDAAILTQGPAFGKATAASPSLGSEDWPTFRGDSARSGHAGTSLPDGLELLWQSAAGQRVGAPVSVADLVVLPLIDEHQILALRTDDGSEAWRFYAGARIDSPPTYDDGAFLFGSADGCVYRVRADDGELIWKRRMSNVAHKIGAFGQLEAAQTVHGSVLVHEGIAYVTVGRSSQLDGGMRIVGLDAKTGQLVREKTFDGPHYNADNVEENYHLPMGVLSDILRMEGDAIFMRSVKLDASLTQQRGLPSMKAPGGLLDDAYFKRMPWSIGGSGHARVLVHDGQTAYCLRMFDSMQGLDPKVYFTPGKEGYLLFAHRLKGGEKPWAVRIPIRGRALAVTDRQLCVAGPPDVVDPADPLAAFEGRKGGVLRVVDKADGSTLGEHRLSAPPVFHGIATANSRLYLTLEDGTVACFGSK